MLMTIVMLLAWQGTNNPIYQGPLQRSIEATYAGSDLKSNVEKVNDKLKDKQPVLTALIPIGYAIGVKKQVSITSSKISLIPNTVASYKYDNNTKAGSVGFVWRF